MSAQNETTQKFLSDARSLKEQVAALKEQVTAIESTIPALIRSVGKNMDEIKTKVDFMAEWMDALVGVVGLESVQEAILTSRTKKAVEAAEAAKAELAALKASGEMVNLDVVEDDVTLVLSEVKNDTNEPVGPGWFKLHTSELKPEFKELLKGKPVGYSERREETTFTVLEVLKAVAVHKTETLPEAAAATTEAVA